MRSRGLLRRLDRLKLKAEQPEKLAADDSGLSDPELCRFAELWHAAKAEKISEEEEIEFLQLHGKFRWVPPDQIKARPRKTCEELKAERELEKAFSRAFKSYSVKYRDIATPSFFPSLNEYRLDIGYRLFERYGWQRGDYSADGILPLEQWEPEDREALIELYRWANPCEYSEFPPGWTSKFNSR